MLPYKGKTKIVIVGPYPLDPSKVSGGIQAVIGNLLKGLRSFSDLELHIVTVDFDQDLEPVEEDGIRLHILRSSKRVGQLTLYIRERRWIAKKIEQVEPHLVHAHGTDMYGFAVRKLRYPTLLTVHGILRQEAKFSRSDLRLWNFLFRRTKGFVNSYFESQTMRHIKHTVIISPYVKEKINGITCSEMYLIDNPVEDRFFELKNREVEHRLLFVGMIRARKGILNLLKSIDILRNNIPNIELHIIGKVFEPDYNNELLDYIEEKRMDKNVIFKGLVSEDELYREFEECSILILPSEEESSPMVVEQAMAASKPVVTTNVGGIPYLIKDDTTGFLVEYGNVRGLAEKILCLLSEPSIRAQMGLAAKKEAEKRFKLSAIAARTRQLYFDVVKKESQDLN